MPFILNGLNIYAAQDKKYTASARTTTIKRFGPSGSLKKKNSILEQIMAVIANIVNETSFDLKYRFAMLSPMSIDEHFPKYNDFTGDSYLYIAKVSFNF
jgi:hypothetical protein